MATKQSNIKVTVVGDANQFSREMGKASGSLTQMDKQISKMNKSMKAIKWGAIGGLAAAGFMKMADSLNEVTKAAISDRREQTALNKVLKNVPGISKKAIAANEDWIDSMEIATHVSDTEYRGAIGRLISTTGDLEEAQRLAALAADVAAGKGISYARAVKQVEAAAKKGGDEIDKLTKNYEGAAEAAADTDPYTKLQVIWGQLQEQLGQVLLPLLDEFSGWFKKPENKKALSTFITNVGKVARAIGEKLVTSLKNIDWNALKEDLDVVAGKLKTAWEWVTDLYGAFDSLSPKTKENIGKILAVLSAYTLASKTPGLKILLDWNEEAIKRTLNRVLGTSFGTVRITAGAVYLTGGVAGVPGAGKQAKRNLQASVTETTDYAYINAKDAAIKAQVSEKDAMLNSRIQALNQAWEIARTKDTAARKAGDAALRAELNAAKATNKAKDVEQDIAIAKAQAASALDVDGMPRAATGKGIWKRLVGHLPLLGDILLISADLIALAHFFKNDEFVTKGYVDTGYSNLHNLMKDYDKEVARQQQINTQVKSQYQETMDQITKVRVEANKAVERETWLRARGIEIVDGRLTTEEYERKRGDGKNAEATEKAQKKADDAYAKALNNAAAIAGFRKMSRYVYEDAAWGAQMAVAHPTSRVAPQQQTTSTTTTSNVPTLGNNYKIEINNQYPEPERASDNLAMSLRMARYALGVA